VPKALQVRFSISIADNLIHLIRFCPFPSQFLVECSQINLTIHILESPGENVDKPLIKIHFI